MLSAPATHGRRSVDEIRIDAERQADAEAEVRAGRAHPLMFDLLRGARIRLEPKATRLAEALPLGASETTYAWGRGYLGRVWETQHRTAGERGRDGTGEGAPDNPAADHRPDVFAQYAEAARQAEAGAEQRAVEVCMVVSPGQPPDVAVRHTSNHAALDQLALDSFRAAAWAHPAEPDVRPAIACYRVRIAAFRVLPLPLLSFTVRNGRVDVGYPLKRLTKITVELVSIDHGDTKPGSRLLREP